MGAGLLFRKRLAAKSIRGERLVVDERLSTGGVFTTLLNPDGDGKNYRLGEWRSSGACVATAAGKGRVFLMGGASGGDASFVGGPGDVVRDCWIDIPVGPHTIIVGAGGGVTSLGSQSKFGTLIETGRASFISTASGVIYLSAAGATDADTSLEYITSITGSPVGYGKRGQASPRANRGDGASAGSGSAGYVAVRWEI
jgi:hypothetical protein